MFNIYNKKESDKLTVYLQYTVGKDGHAETKYFEKSHSAEDILIGDGDWIHSQLEDVKEFLLKWKVNKRDYSRIINHYVGSFHDFKRTATKEQSANSVAQ